MGRGPRVSLCIYPLTYWGGLGSVNPYVAVFQTKVSPDIVSGGGSNPCLVLED